MRRRHVTRADSASAVPPNQNSNQSFGQIAASPVVSQFELMLRQAQHEGLGLGLIQSLSKDEAAKLRQYRLAGKRDARALNMLIVRFVRFDPPHLPIADASCARAHAGRATGPSLSPEGRGRKPPAPPHSPLPLWERAASGASG